MGKAMRSRIWAIEDWLRSDCQDLREPWSHKIIALHHCSDPGYAPPASAHLMALYMQMFQPDHRSCIFCHWQNTACTHASYIELIWQALFSSKLKPFQKPSRVDTCSWECLQCLPLVNACKARVKVSAAKLLLQEAKFLSCWDGLPVSWHLQIWVLDPAHSHAGFAMRHLEIARRMWTSNQQVIVSVKH